MISATVVPSRRSEASRPRRRPASVLIPVPGLAPADQHADDDPERGAEADRLPRMLVDEVIGCARGFLGLVDAGVTHMRELHLGDVQAVLDSGARRRNLLACL